MHFLSILVDVQTNGEKKDLFSVFFLFLMENQLQTKCKT